MKKLFILSISLLATHLVQSQEQYIGLATSPRGGQIAADLNPAELSNMRYKYEVGIFSVSAGAFNNKVNFSDVSSKTDTELFNTTFQGENANIRADFNITYPSFAMKIKKWGLGLNMQSHGKVALYNLNTDLATAFRGEVNGSSVKLVTPINIKDNQRATAATWSEINLTTSRVLFENGAHRLNAGLTLKFLMPAMFANVSADQLSGRIIYTPEIVTNKVVTTPEKYELDGVSNAHVNIAYSGSVIDQSPKAFGGINGFGSDIGLSYQLKDTVGFYKMNLGLSIKNIGSMTYESKPGEDSFNTYVFNSNAGPTKSPLDLGTISGDVDDVKADLESRGYLKSTEKGSSQQVKLPTVFVLYSDIRIVPKFHVSVYTQQRIGDPTDNYQIPTQTVYSLTPRFTIKYFDAYSTWSSYEVSGISGGLGFRVGGFFIGSNSIITGLAGGKNIDVNMGARWAFGE